MNQTPSTIDNSDLQDEDLNFQSYIRQESAAEKKGNYSISANNKVQCKNYDQINCKEGWLLKKSPKLLVGWQVGYFGYKRYVRLQDGKMLYFKGIDKFKGCIDFHLIQVFVHSIKKNNELHEIKLELAGVSKSFHFKSLESKDLSDWLRCIQQNIQLTLSYPKMVPLKSESMWRFERISESYFKKRADTGDLLLFRGQSALSKIQRAFTRDNYDHVALLLRYNNGELFLFESMGQTGVALTSWDTFMRNQWNKLYAQMVYRQLDLDRSNQVLENLDQFIKNSIGKRYQFSPGKLMKKFTRTRENVEELEKDNKTFFCSELIAAAYIILLKRYKKMEILDCDKCAASYWPGMFAQGSKLHLRKGSLKQEQLIDFSLI